MIIHRFHSGIVSCLLLPALLALAAHAQFGPPGTTTESAMDPQTRQAAQKVQQACRIIVQENFLKLTPLKPAEIAVIERGLEEPKRFSGRFNKSARANLAIIEAILAHYRGDKEEALDKAQVAYEDAPENWDTGDLLIALALYYDRFDLATQVLEQRQAGQAVLADPPEPEPEPEIGGPAEPNLPSATGSREPNVPSAAQTNQTPQEASRWEQLFQGQAAQPGIPGARDPRAGQQLPASEREEPIEIPIAPAASAQALLKLPVDYMPFEPLGKPFPTVTLGGINATYLHYPAGQGQALCLLLWSSAEPRQIRRTAAVGGAFGGYSAPPDFSGMDPTFMPMPGGSSPFGRTFDSKEIPQPAFDLEKNAEQFTVLFFQNVLQRKLLFASLNFDTPSAENLTKLLERISSRPNPWLTTMTWKRPNDEVWPFQNIRGAVLMIVNTKGLVTYVGPVGGFLPRMLLDKAIANASVPRSVDTPLPEEPFAATPEAPGVDLPTPETAEPAAPVVTQPPVQPQNTTPQPAEDPQARQMLRTAQLQRRLSPNRALTMCDDVIERWPNTTEAQDARLLIRSILREPANRNLLQLRQQGGKYTGVDVQ